MDHDKDQLGLFSIPEETPEDVSDFDSGVENPAGALVAELGKMNVSASSARSFAAHRRRKMMQRPHLLRKNVLGFSPIASSAIDKRRNMRHKRDKTIMDSVRHRVIEFQKTRHLGSLKNFQAFQGSISQLITKNMEMDKFKKLLDSKIEASDTLTVESDLNGISDYKLGSAFPVLPSTSYSPVHTQFKSTSPRPLHSLPNLCEEDAMLTDSE